MRVPEGSHRRQGGSVLQNLRAGFGYAYRTRLVFTMLLVATIPTVFAIPYSQLLPVFAKSVYNIGAGGLGLLLTSMGVGALLGSLVIANVGDRAPKGLVLLASLIAFGTLLCLFAVIQVLPIALLCLAGIGASMELSNVFTARLPYPTEKREGSPVRGATEGHAARALGATFGSLLCTAVAISPVAAAEVLTSADPVAVRIPVLLVGAACYGIALAWAGVRIAARVAEPQLPELCQIALYSMA